MKKKQKNIVHLSVTNWNKLTKKEQDESIIFIVRVLSDLSEYRKVGISDEFRALN